jgi:hypothetical protein
MGSQERAARTMKGALMNKKGYEMLVDDAIDTTDIPYAKKTMDTIIKEFFPYFQNSGDLASGLMVTINALVYQVKTEEQYHEFLEAMEQLMGEYMKMKLLLSVNNRVPN